MASADTILAVSTPMGYSPRAVVRLSGPEALECARERFRPVEQGAEWDRTFRATRGEFHLPGSRVSVPVLLYVMRAPHSYTREDVVELHVPGSPALLDLLLEDVLAHGPARLRTAEPGEFTRRAFLNGRIDLSQAEAVLGIIRARTEAELLAAAARLGGSVSRRCQELQEHVTELRVQVEAALDFAPHGIEIVAESELLERCAELRTSMEAEARAARDAVASEGRIRVAIAGPPNAGKSSLLNLLAHREAALVHGAAGTTRDAVSAEVSVGDVHFRITDTAGLRDYAAGVDAQAVEHTRRLLRSSQLAVLVLDGSVPLANEALHAVRELPPGRVLCVVNKCDLEPVLDVERLRSRAVAQRVLRTSAMTGEGIDELRRALAEAVTEGRVDVPAAAASYTARQGDGLRRAACELGEAARAVRNGLGYEFAALNLREAADALGRVTGKVTSQDVLDGIFGRFCIGK